MKDVVESLEEVELFGISRRWPGVFTRIDFGDPLPPSKFDKTPLSLVMVLPHVMVLGRVMVLAHCYGLLLALVIVQCQTQSC